MGKTIYTFGVYAKTSRGTEYVSHVGNFELPEYGIGYAINKIAEILHRAPCDVFIEAINDCPLENPTGLYGKLEVAL